jgi:hypothetical protein
MDGKLEHIAALMSQNSPAQLDLDALRRRALERVDDMRRDLVKAVDEWVTIMRGHLLSSLGFDDLARMRGEMEKLTEEVGLLRGALQGSGQPAAIKKVFQIDAEKLEESYSAMFARFKETQKKAEFEFAIDWKQIVKSFETHINIRNRNEILEQTEQTEWKEPSRDHNTSREGSSSRSDRVYDLRGE